MSELLQSGQHPDADQLSAFVEHVLPAHEQEETLAHLAVCPVCRSIVALSLPAVEEQPIPRPVRRPWLSGWNLVWSGTAALAATVLVGVLLRSVSSAPSRVPSEVPAQTARAAPPAPPVVLHQLLPEAAGTSSQQTPPLSAAPSGATAATKQKTAEVPPGLHDRQLQTAPAVSGVAGGIANRAATPTFGAAQSSVSVTAANDALQTENIVLRSTVVSDQAQVILNHHPLPSGLHALSAVANGRQALAIDAHNVLFLSDDGGEHWSAISAPWQSHAVKVELASSTTGNSLDAMGVAAHFQQQSPAPLGIVVPNESATQAKSSIRGDVTDLSGASIPNVSVSVTNSLTRVSHSTTTDGSGHYAFDNLDPGTYALEAKAPGFASQQLSAVALNPAQQSQMNLKLAVGSLSQTVEVQGQDRLVTMAPMLGKTFAARHSILSRFEITTDTGEKWTSADGRSWMRK
jgi:Carboxypeptidase regulatory-like domain